MLARLAVNESPNKGAITGLFQIRALQLQPGRAQTSPQLALRCAV